jgi:hypothetical protein
VRVRVCGWKIKVIFDQLDPCFSLSCMRTKFRSPQSPMPSFKPKSQLTQHPVRPRHSRLKPAGATRGGLLSVPPGLGRRCVAGVGTMQVCRHVDANKNHPKERIHCRQHTNKRT